jgi:hypothetical protein
MADGRPIETIVDQIVREAHIPGRAARDDLRRELLTHFEEAAASPERLEEALRRFGNPELLARHFRDIYQWEYVALYLAKLALSVVAAVAAALAVQVLINLRVEIQTEALRLAPEFPKAALRSVAVVLGLVTAWEIGRRPFELRRALIALSAYAAICVFVQAFFALGLQMFGSATVLVLLGLAASRLQQRPATILRTFAVFAAATYLVHLGLSVPLGPGRALTAGIALVVVWTTTVAILARCDRVFVNLFTTSGGDR